MSSVPSNSPWASPVVMVKKKDRQHAVLCGLQATQCTDTVKDAHPTPLINDFLDALHGDLLVLHPRSQEWILAGPYPGTGQGEDDLPHQQCAHLFEFNQVPFSLCNAPATFSRLMDQRPGQSPLGDLPVLLGGYYSLRRHLGRSTWPAFAKSLSVSDTHNSSSAPNKCTFTAKEVSYLAATESPKKASYPIPLY